MMGKLEEGIGVGSTVVGVACLNVTFDLCATPGPARAALSATEGGRRGDAGWARASIQQRSTNKQQAGASPAQVKRRAQFTLVRCRNKRVVEILDDGVGRPANGHQDEEPCHGKKYTGDACQPRFQARLTHTLGALDAQDAEGQCQGAEQDGEHGEATGRLHVTG